MRDCIRRILIVVLRGRRAAVPKFERPRASRVLVFLYRNILVKLHTGSAISRFSNRDSSKLALYTTHSLS